MSARAQSTPIRCRVCERSFTPTGANTLCAVCYAERRGDYDFALAEQAWREGYGIGLARGRRQRADDELEQALDDLRLRELITLCHPDRHPPERFELANRVTVWLLGLRETVPES
jgi:hypothetical protein